MKRSLMFCIAALGALSLNAASLMPAKDKISIGGADGSSFKAENGLLMLNRETPGIQVFLRGMVNFKEKVSADFAADDALVIELRSAADTVLRTRWRKTDRTVVDGIEMPVRGSADFQEVVIPLPTVPGKAFQSLLLEFQPDPKNVAIRKIAIEKPRRVTLSVVGNVAKVQSELTVRGTTAVPDAEVTVHLRNSRGEVKTRTVRSRNGVYELKWNRPPVNIGLWNSVYASINGGKEIADTSIQLPLFGYRADDAHTWLRVKGKEIVTSPLAKDGEKRFIPVGVGYCRDVIIPAQDEEVMKFCKARGMNTIRLPFYVRFFNNNESVPLDIDEHIRDFILPVVLAAKRHNLYVILDDHGYFSAKIDEAKAREKQSVDRWSEAGVAKWIECWVKVAEYFKDEPTVLGYELLNEPHDIKPETTREWYTRCLKAIRQVDQRHIILLGNADWSHARAMEKTWGPTASTVDAPHDNVVFIFHDYPEDNHAWQVADYVTAFRDKHNVPVLCTEFGATPWAKSETVCRSFIAGMLTLCAKEDIGWMIWALKRLEDNPRSTYNKVDKVGMDPLRYDSCAYSDLCFPAARIMATPFPKAK